MAAWHIIFITNSGSVMLFSYIYIYIYIYISIPVCERSKEKLGMYGSYPPGNNYQVLINSQFGVNQINFVN